MLERILYVELVVLENCISLKCGIYTTVKVKLILILGKMLKTTTLSKSWKINKIDTVPCGIEPTTSGAKNSKCSKTRTVQWNKIAYSK